MLELYTGTQKINDMRIEKRKLVLRCHRCLFVKLVKASHIFKKSIAFFRKMCIIYLNETNVADRNGGAV